MRHNGAGIDSPIEIPPSELTFRTSRSGGPGGQNVNKVESKVELTFDVRNSPFLSDEQRARILARLGNKIDSGGILHLTSQSSRSQLENRDIVTREFVKLLRTALRPVKKRIPTRPTKTSREKRLKAKKIAGAKKKQRSSRAARDD